MRQSVRGAVTAMARPRGAAPRPRPGDEDLIGRPVFQAPPRTQPPDQIADRERDDRGEPCDDSTPLLWAALGEGRDLPLTHVEQWVPVIFTVAHVVAFCGLVV
ncbi:hypothetical protein [Streptomyces tendae]